MTVNKKNELDILEPKLFHQKLKKEIQKSDVQKTFLNYSHTIHICFLKQSVNDFRAVLKLVKKKE